MPRQYKKRFTREELFWQKVDKEIGPIHPTLGRCWMWLASFPDGLYGQFWVGDTYKKAHVFSYELVFGPVPEGLVLDHLCKNTLCVHPLHLEAVTQRINVIRGEGIGAINAAKTHCIHGHQFNESNTYIHPQRGTRHCKECPKMANSFDKCSATVRDLEIEGYKMRLTLTAEGAQFMRIGGKRGDKPVLLVPWNQIMEIGAEKQGVSAYQHLGFEE